MKITEISVWEAFAAVAKHGNFAKASRHLGVSVPQLSKRVSRLEAQLGARLFQRSTRSVSLTNEGSSILPRVKEIIEELSNIETQFENQDELIGTLRLSTIPFIAHRLLIPIISDFTKRYPKLKIELELSESLSPIIESNIDLAIRIQEPKDSDLIYRKLAENKLVFCASPQYIKENSTPQTPNDLHTHKMLMLRIHKNCKVKSDSNNSYKLNDFADSRSILCENGAYLTELALAGQGILVRSIWDVYDDLKKAKLVQLLKKYPIESFGNIYAVIPSRKFLAPRVRLFLDAVSESAKKWQSV